MPHYVASDLGLHCLPMTLLQVSRLEWVKGSTLPGKMDKGDKNGNGRGGSPEFVPI